MFGLFENGKKQPMKCINWHPDMDVALAYMNSGNWTELTNLLSKQTNNSRFALIQSCGTNGPLGVLPTNIPATPDADLFLGGVRTQWAWRYRGGAIGIKVGVDAGLLFLQELEAAEEHLARVLEVQPNNSLAIGFYVRVATGLGDREKRDELVQRLVLADDPPVESLGFALQSQSPKWSGSFDLMFSFARDAIARQNIHPSRHALIASAHVEKWLYDCHMDGDKNKAKAAQKYLVSSAVVDEVLQAQARFTVEMNANNAAKQDVFAAKFAHNNLGYALYRAGQKKLAAEHVESLNTSPSELPWSYSIGTPVAAKWGDLRKDLGLSKEIRG